MQEKGEGDSEDYSSQSLPAVKKTRQIPKKRVAAASILDALSDHAAAALHDTLLAPVPIVRSASAGSLYPGQKEKKGILPIYRNAPSPRSLLSNGPSIVRQPSPTIRPSSRNSATSSPRPQDSRSRLIVETVCLDRC